MKISVNLKFREDVQGGGVKFAKDLRDYFLRQGFQVVKTLKDGDIDLIINICPFPFLMKAPSYSFLDSYVYKLKHPRTIIVAGIHECDERKGTRHMNKLLIKTAKYADALTFVSSWLKPLLEKQGLDTNKPNKIILHGGNTKIFNAIGKPFWDHKRKMRVITHHWGGSYEKGHDIYQRMDALLDRPEFADKFEFTYAGDYPKNLTYKNARLIKIYDYNEMARELRNSDVYLMASRNEPAGMSHVEGALCGSPVMYIDSGSLKEYLDGYGMEFTPENFEEKLMEMYNNYDFYLARALKYNRTAEKMAAEHWAFYSRLLKEREKYAVKSSWLKIIWFSIYAKLYHLYWFFKRRTL
jgi:hypothetical protein